MDYSVLAFSSFLILTSCSDLSKVADSEVVESDSMEEVQSNAKEEKVIEVIVDQVMESRSPMLIKITPLKPTYQVMVGDTLAYSAVEHGSVGKQVDVNISNLRVLKEISRDFKYNNPQIKGMKGGDKGIRIYMYEVLIAGEVTMKIQSLYRGAIENDYEINITAVR